MSLCAELYHSDVYLENSTHAPVKLKSFVNPLRPNLILKGR